MKIAALFQRSRRRMSGAVVSSWDLLEELSVLGHEVRIGVMQKPRRLRGFPVGKWSGKLAQWSDVVLAQPGPLQEVKRIDRPVVGLVHSAVVESWSIRACARAQAILWASRTLRDRSGDPRPGLVAYPVIYAHRVRVPGPGTHVTLVGLSEDKGVGLLKSIAGQMPATPFLAVQSGWQRTAQENVSLPANVTVRRYQTDPRRVYAASRVVLYPRGPGDPKDGWLSGVGRVALEAAASGIPTVAFPGPGLIESMGDGATWVDSHDPSDWATAIAHTLNSHWESRSQAALTAWQRYPTPAETGRAVADFLGTLC